MHAVLVQSTIAAGSITGFDLKEAEGMPGVLAIITPDNAGKLSHPEKVPQAVHGPLLQNKDILFNGQHVAVVVADTLEQAQAAASAVRVSYRRGEAATSMDAMLGQAYAPKHFRNGAAAAGLQPRRSGRRLQQRRGQAGRDLHHAGRAPQPDGAARHDRAPGTATS